MLEKSVNVYLPYGYDENQEYDILYLLHGTGGFEDYWIGDSSTGKVTCNVLDNMIEAGECEPVIVVSPTYYSPTEEMGYRKMDPMELFNNEKDPYADQWPMYFWKELRNDIIPLIESTYSTYAEKRCKRGEASKDKRSPRIRRTIKGIKDNSEFRNDALCRSVCLYWLLLRRMGRCGSV